jgi:hypothetical protein
MDYFLSLQNRWIFDSVKAGLSFFWLFRQSWNTMYVERLVFQYLDVVVYFAF